MDAAKYWAFTRGDPGELLRPNLDALAVLRSVRKGVRKIVLTNCAEKQAREALRVLGIEDEFAACTARTRWGRRVSRCARRSRRSGRWTQASRTLAVFFEDSVKNLASAKAHFGTFTVQIGERQDRGGGGGTERRVRRGRDDIGRHRG